MTDLGLMPYPEGKMTNNQPQTASRKAHEYLDELARLHSPSAAEAFIRRAVESEKRLPADRGLLFHVIASMNNLLSVCQEQGPRALLAPRYALSLDQNLKFWLAGKFRIEDRRKIRRIVARALAPPPGRPPSSINRETLGRVNSLRVKYPDLSLKEIRSLLAPRQAETLKKRLQRARKQKQSS